MKLKHLFIFIIFICGKLVSHPIPDLSVFGSFEANGSSSVFLSIDPRCFEKDPEEIPFLTVEQFETLSKEKRELLLEQAGEFVKNSLQVRINQGEWFLPNFIFDFEKKDGGEPAEEEVLVFIRGVSNLRSESVILNYQIRALEDAPYDLVFSNAVGGIPQRRVNVLWPGEESFVLDLSSMLSQSEPNEQIKAEIPELSGSDEHETKEDVYGIPGPSTFLSFFRQGFVHVLPLGLDHILFVLGIFLLTRKFRPLILQVSVFTVAHTITLGLATLDLVSAPSNVVEPIIAASIAVVALENIFFPNYRHSRLFIVFFFGLIHGLGFAGALSAFDLDPTSLVIGLLGFNVGVEFGQLAVIAIVFVLTIWIKDEAKYRKLAVIPCSILIAVMGIFWTIERVFF